MISSDPKPSESAKKLGKILWRKHDLAMDLTSSLEALARAGRALALAARINACAPREPAPHFTRLAVHSSQYRFTGHWPLPNRLRKLRRFETGTWRTSDAE